MVYLILGLSYYVIWFVLFVSLILTECYKLREVRDVNPIMYNRKWHFWKGLYQFCILLLFTYEVGWRFGLLSGVLYWILHDVFTNIIGLKMPWYYVGKTSFIDKIFKRPTFIFAFKILMLTVALIVLWKK